MQAAIQPLPEWIYQNRKITCLEDLKALIDFEPFGFVYVVNFADGRRYLGKKDFFSIQTLPALQGEKKRSGHLCFVRKRKDHKLIVCEKVKLQSNWLDYQGSASECRALQAVRKDILLLCQSRRQLTYEETRFLFILKSEKKLHFFTMWTEPTFMLISATFRYI